MIIVLIPLFGYVYNKYHRKVLTTLFIIIGLGASMIPVMYVSLAHNVVSFPGFMSNAYSEMYTKIYFRIPPFLIGIALGIFHFEYRHVEKLKDGSKPFHRDYIQKIIKKYPRMFNFICYLVGMLLMVIAIGALVYNSTCITKVGMSTVFLKQQDIQYCWASLGGGLYYTISPIVFYSGLTLVLLPCLIGVSSILKPMMNSHLWHIMEELTFNAYLIQYLIVVWFFASREQNTLLSAGYILQITVSSWILSYLVAVPFYMIVERPFKNFLDLILFPKSSIFKKQKDLDDDDDDDSSDSSTDNDKNASPVKKSTDGKKKEILCGFCQEDGTCDCKCLVTKKKCKCIDKVDSVLKPSVAVKVNDSLLESKAGTLTKSELEKKRVSFDVAFKK